MRVWARYSGNVEESTIPPVVEVTLAGSMASWAERGQTMSAAWSAPGVNMVENHLTVTPRALAAGPL